MGHNKENERIERARAAEADSAQRWADSAVDRRRMTRSPADTLRALVDDTVAALADRMTEYALCADDTDCDVQYWNQEALEAMDPILSAIIDVAIESQWQYILEELADDKQAREDLDADWRATR